MCFEVTSFKSTKSSQILTLAQNVDLFNADVNLKYERCNFNSYLEKLKRSAPGAVRFLIEPYSGWEL
jgi:hypothetical protein